jgi:hypothetical protein
MRICQGCGRELTGAARKWCSQRCRRDTCYGGVCTECGARTSGARGPGHAASRCFPCAHQALPVAEKRERNAARVKRYYQQKPEVVKRLNKEYARRNREKRAAWRAVSKTLREGTLSKPERCESCDAAVRLNGHHDDYDKPLEVAWLCPLCHKATHLSAESV